MIIFNYGRKRIIKKLNYKEYTKKDLLSILNYVRNPKNVKKLYKENKSDIFIFIENIKKDKNIKINYDIINHFLSNKKLNKEIKDIGLLDSFINSPADFIKKYKFIQEQYLFNLEDFLNTTGYDKLLQKIDYNTAVKLQKIIINNKKLINILLEGNENYLYPENIFYFKKNILNKVSKREIDILSLEVILKNTKSLLYKDIIEECLFNKEIINLNTDTYLDLNIHELLNLSLFNNTLEFQKKEKYYKDSFKYMKEYYEKNNKVLIKSCSDFLFFYNRINNFKIDKELKENNLLVKENLDLFQDVLSFNEKISFFIKTFIEDIPLKVFPYFVDILEDKKLLKNIMLPKYLIIFNYFDLKNKEEDLYLEEQYLKLSILKDKNINIEEKTMNFFSAPLFKKNQVLKENNIYSYMNFFEKISLKSYKNLSSIFLYSFIDNIMLFSKDIEKSNLEEFYLRFKDIKFSVLKFLSLSIFIEMKKISTKDFEFLLKLEFQEIEDNILKDELYIDFMKQDNYIRAYNYVFSSIEKNRLLDNFNKKTSNIAIKNNRRI